MAKRKRKKKTEKTFEYSSELLGILLMLVAIIGIGKYGPIGRLISSFALFLVGSLYIVLLAILFVFGCYLLIKRKKPNLMSTKLVGLYIFALGILTMMHKEFVMQNNGNVGIIFKETVNQLVKGFNGIMTDGITNVSVGGGLIGGALSIAFTKLFSYSGMKIVSWVMVIVGALIFAGFTYIDKFKEVLKNVKDKKNEAKELKNNKTSVIISGNDSEEDDDDEKQQNHIKISSIDELTKIADKDAKKDQSDTLTEEKQEEKITYNKEYKLPPVSLLNPVKKKPKGNDESSIEKNIVVLEKVLRDFKIEGKVVEVHVGPAVAQYELEIASGTRVNKITSINREIALALAKKDVRIEAPIPGKNTVGIEFANEVSTPVSFREIIDSKLMNENMDKKLMVPLGKSIMGDIGVCHLNKMPHLLIAGTTGSGKSVCVNGIICSILMRAKPSEVKLVLVDPKVVELSVYNGVPHLMCPVVTDPKKASVALAKMVAEMERRYEVFSENKVKNIEGYNEYIAKWNNEHKDLDAKKNEMPYIVVIIDELSDLMMVAAKEVEDSILRITQKARAAGIHLIVATQRPSTEVITGLIKANIPSRISFAVGSGIDSRTILDQVGAEKLLGRGDMLYLPIGTNVPVRYQGSFITDDEIKKLIDFTVEQQKAQYDESLLNLESPEAKSQSEPVSQDVTQIDDDDPLYNEIVEFVVETQKASASLLQRKFKLGYNRAARIIDLLEERGIIGPSNGSKPRDVLVQLDPPEESE